MIDEPSAGKYYGGEVAAPVFSGIMESSLRSLGVMPDLSRLQAAARQVPATPPTVRAARAAQVATVDLSGERQL